MEHHTKSHALPPCTEMHVYFNELFISLDLFNMAHAYVLENLLEVGVGVLG